MAGEASTASLSRFHNEAHVDRRRAELTPRRRQAMTRNTANQKAAPIKAPARKWRARIKARRLSVPIRFEIDVEIFIHVSDSVIQGVQPESWVAKPASVRALREASQRHH